MERATEGVAAVVFADLSADRPSFHVVPSWWLRRDLAKRYAEAFPTGVRPVNPESRHAAVDLEHIEQWGQEWRTTSSRLRRPRPARRRSELTDRKNALACSREARTEGAEDLDRQPARTSPYHLGATGSIKVVGAGRRTLAIVWGRCYAMRLLHSAAALFGCC